MDSNTYDHSFPHNVNLFSTRYTCLTASYSPLRAPPVCTLSSAYQGGGLYTTPAYYFPTVYEQGIHLAILSLHVYTYEMGVKKQTTFLKLL